MSSLFTFNLPLDPSFWKHTFLFSPSLQTNLDYLWPISYPRHLCVPVWAVRQSLAVRYCLLPVHPSQRKSKHLKGLWWQHGYRTGEKTNKQTNRKRSNKRTGQLNNTIQSCTSEINFLNWHTQAKFPSKLIPWLQQDACDFHLSVQQRETGIMEKRSSSSPIGSGPGLYWPVPVFYPAFWRCLVVQIKSLVKYRFSSSLNCFLDRTWNYKFNIYAFHYLLGGRFLN